MTSEVSGELEWEWVKKAIEQHQSSLIRYAASILRDNELAKDVVQDTFIKLCQTEFSSVKDHLIPWLFRVTRNRALDVLRKEKRMSQFEEPETMASLADVGVGEAKDERDKREAIDTLLQLVRSLPGKQREVVLLKFQQDLSYKEISEITGMSVSNVGYVLHHALKDLKQRWKMVEAA